ncbi:uncharacterized protein [Nicotiana sylvestris]|uniref:uncharacterized protein n=1 Tax=Nicotiana sylvestris TaxID=4096 RepID=UPI00388CEB73
MVNEEPTTPFNAAKGLRGDAESVATLHRCFKEFSDASGLQANKETSSIYFGGVAQGVQDQILKFLGFLKGELPFRYLGIPLATKKILLVQWQPFINKMVSRITSWTAKKLSYAGRAQLIQTVLFGIQAYWSQLWLHAYYIKNQQFGQMDIPLQAGWMVRKMFEARNTLALIQNNTVGSLIKQIYLQLIGNNERILWKTLRFGNNARPKAQFTIWLQMQGKLLTVDRIAS